ncbi:MAG TPA: site-specific DNA-methyltransferase [Candidatus Magasanikbacteria bacterium]|nr:site-specific DNA-methyltransferase [Candidatus Magasanikbacteria bacterium]
MSKKETLFKNALRDIFTGADIEGTSGYVNLLKIKKQYFDTLFPELNREIEADTRIDGDFKEEFYDKLFNFFHRYFSESGSIYFRHTPNYQKVYEQVYTEGKDVVLFWKTHMLYYVKSDVIFQSIPIEIKDETSNPFSFFIDASGIENKQSNERKNLVFVYEKVVDKDGKKTIFITAQYSERGNKTKIESIYKAIKDAGVKNISQEVIEKAFRVFEKQSEVDFFINKDARGFLKEQFDLYMYNWMFKELNDFSHNRFKKVQALKDWAERIIDFIGQFEDELVKVWNKPKFVRNTNYVLTMDKLSDELIKNIKNHSGTKDQIKEWIELGIVKADFDFTKKLSEKEIHLPIDTKFFKSIESELITEQGNLDESIDGFLIHSENYQALNTIKEKFHEKVKCIYIDPPFNLDGSDQFLYRTNYKDSNWASLLENRLRLAHGLLKDEGSIFVRCDNNGNYIVRSLLDSIFSSENFKGEIILNRFQKESDGITNTTESLFLYSKDYKKFKMNSVSRERQCIYCKREIDPKWQWAHSAGSSELPKYFEVDGKRVLLYPPKGRHWTNGQEKIDELTKLGQIRINKDLKYTDSQGNKISYTPERLQDPHVSLDNNWTDIPGYEFGVFSSSKFSTENADEVLQRVIQLCSNEGDIVCDFFLGSGTTTENSLLLKRKFIGIEMGEHFDSIVIPQMKKVASSVSTFFKYYSLEQYEETLARAKYSKNSDLTIWDNNKSPFAQYVFKTDQKLSEFIKTSDNDLSINFSLLYPDIDIAETLSNVTGKLISRKTPDSVEFIDGTIEKINPEKITLKEKIHLIQIMKPLIWWGE